MSITFYSPVLYTGEEHVLVGQWQNNHSLWPTAIKLSCCQGGFTPPVDIWVSDTIKCELLADVLHLLLLDLGWDYHIL